MALVEPTLTVPAEEGDRYLFVRDLPQGTVLGDVVTVCVGEAVYVARVLTTGTLEVLQRHSEEILH